MTSSSPEKLELKPHQAALLEALAEKDQRVARMYQGALQVMTQTSNSDRFALAAHGVRELMEKAPKYFHGAFQERLSSLGERTRQFVEVWKKEALQSTCHVDGAWNGQVDPKLEKFLRHVVTFVEAYERDQPSRRQQVGEMLRLLDPLKLQLPEPIRELRIEEWILCRDFFIGVAHHGRETEESEFFGWLGVLERFMLNQLRPHTFDDHRDLDKIIDQGEGHVDS